MVLTFHLVCIAWVFFRMPRLSDAAPMVREMLLPSTFEVDFSARMMAYQIVALAGIVTAAFLTRMGRQTPKIGPMLRGATAAVMLFITLISWGDPNEFIYFQF